MKLFITHDLAGTVTGRFSASDPKQMENYPSAVEIDTEDYHAKPEIWGEVDVVKKTLHPKPGKSDPTSKRRGPRT